MANGARAITTYSVPISTAASALNVVNPIAVSWEGVGSGGNLIFQTANTVTSNNPINGITKTQQNYTVIPWTTVYNQFFSSINASKFVRMTVIFDSPQTTIFVNLNLEE